MGTRVCVDLSTSDTLQLFNGYAEEVAHMYTDMEGESLYY